MKSVSCYMMMTLLLVLLLGVAEAGLTGQKDHIEPELEPKSDKKFFGDDYPADERPPVIARFSHPYPAVQDSEDYDVDYVKDENSDRGEWWAQMEYDRLKNAYAKQLRDVEEARAKEKEERLEWEA